MILIKKEFFEIKFYYITMVSYLVSLYKNLIIYIKEYLIFFNIKKNNPYLDLTLKFMVEIWQNIKLFKNEVIDFKVFIKDLNPLQYIILIYLFFLGIIPLIILIVFWLFFIYFLIYLFLLCVDIFLFKFLLIYTKKNTTIYNVYKIFSKLKSMILFLFNKIFYKFILNYIAFIFKILTFKWWLIFIKKFIIKPMDKLLCLILDKFFNFFSYILRIFKILFQKLYTFILILKDNWFISYKPNLNKKIISLKLLRYYRINWDIHFSVIIKYIFLFRSIIKTLINKWFWLYYLNFYLYDLYSSKFYIKFKAIFVYVFYFYINLKLYIIYRYNYYIIYTLYNFNRIYYDIIKFNRFYYIMLINYNRNLINNIIIIYYKIVKIINYKILNYYLNNSGHITNYNLDFTNITTFLIIIYNNNSYKYIILYYWSIILYIYLKWVN